MKNSAGGAEPDRSSPIAGARKNKTKAGETFNRKNPFLINENSTDNYYVEAHNSFLTMIR